MGVSFFTRERGTRRYRSANPKTLYPAGTIYVLRYTLNGKKIWETLPTGTTHHTAKVLAMEKECAFLKGEVVTPALKSKPAPAYRRFQTTSPGLWQGTYPVRRIGFWF